MAERYHFTLSDELLERAVNELNEPRLDEDRWSAIDMLRSSYDQEKHGALLRSDDLFFLKFLRAKKFDQKKSLSALQNYHAVQKDYKHVFEKVSNPLLMGPIVEKGMIVILDGESKEGACCMLLSVRKLGDHDLFDLTAYTILSLEKLLEDEKYQICGIEIIEDCASFNLSALTKVSLIDLAKMQAALQNSLPMRLRAIHIVNEGKFYDVIMALMRPFMKKKILDRIHMYGAKYKAMHEFIDSSVLPPDFEGTGKDLGDLTERWVATLMEDWSQDTEL